MKKIFSWGKVLPLLGVSVLAAGILAFASSSQSSAYNRGHDDTKYVLTLTEATDGTLEATEEEATTPEDGKTKIELSSYRLLEDEPDGTENQAAQEADFGNNNLRFQADSGKASPMLFEKSSTGEVIPEATLLVKKGKWSNETMTFNMTNLMVTSYQNTASDDEDDQEPQDIVILSYETLEIVHADDGKVWKHNWSFKHDKEM